MRYLDELDWVSAMAQFERVLSLDPRNVDAYLGLAEAYCYQRRLPEAVELLRGGFELTGDELLQLRLTRLEAVEPMSVEELIRGVLGKASGELTDADFASVRVLDITNRAVTDISLLSRCTGLEELYMASNFVTDLSPLAGLSSLGRLCAVDNRIGDFGFLTSLSGLTNLELSVTQDELDLIASLESVRYVRLYGEITDLSPLAGLSQLVSLSVSEYPAGYSSRYIQSLSNPAWTPGKTRLDLSPLEGLSSLISLRIEYFVVEDVSVLTKLGQLVDLVLISTRTEELSPIGELTSLRRLQLTGFPELDLACIAPLTGLEYLTLGYCGIEDISILAGFAELRELGLYGNPIADWSPVAHIAAVDGRT